MIKTFCDRCHNELTRNVVQDRLVFRRDGTTFGFSAEVIVSKNDVANDGALCLDCLLKMLTTVPKKPRKPRSDKGSHKGQTAEQVASSIIDKITPELQELEEGLNSEGLTLIKPAKKRGKRTIPGKPDISTFSVSVGQGDQPHTLRLGEVAVSSTTLREGVADLLGLCGIDQKYVEETPESEGKRNLLDILKGER